MLSIIKLRLVRLKDDYWVFLLMTAMALGFTFIMASANNGDYTPTVLVVDEDGSDFSKELVLELENNNAFRYDYSSEKEAIAKVEDGKALAAVMIDKGFKDTIQKGESPRVSMVKTKEDRDIMTLEQILSSTTGKMIGNIRTAQITANAMDSASDSNHEEIFNRAYNKAVEAWRYKNPIEIKKETYKSQSNYDNTKHGIIGFSIFFSMYTIVFAVAEVLNERKNNTWQRLMVSPISRASILGGNFVMAYLVGMVQMSIIIFAGQFIFSIDFGPSIPGIMLVTSAFVFVVTSLGLFLSGLVRTHGQLSALAPVVLTSTAMLGGCMWPLEIVNSKLLLALANITPQKWAIQGMEKMAIYGEGIEAALLPTIVLIGMGIVFFGLGVRLVKYE